MKRNGNAERRMSVGVRCGVSPPHRGGRGLCPSPEKNFDFGSQYGEFWCILGVIFYSYLFYTQNRSSTAIGI